MYLKRFIGRDSLGNSVGTKIVGASVGLSVLKEDCRMVREKINQASSFMLDTHGLSVGLNEGEPVSAGLNVGLTVGLTVGKSPTATTVKMISPGFSTTNPLLSTTSYAQMSVKGGSMLFGGVYVTSRLFEVTRHVPPWRESTVRS